MEVAILMSTYNGQKYLDEQLNSLASQTVSKSISVYIRDDGSSDETFDIIKKWQDRLRIVLYKGKNAGPAMSFWNLLMDSTIHADYYAFCDQDDIWDRDKLEIAIKHIEKDNHFYACNSRIIDENGLLIKDKRLESAPSIVVKRLFVSGCTQGCSMVFDDQLRKYIQQVNPKCVPMHDVILMLYALNYGGIYWDQTPHFSYRVHSNNVVAKNNKNSLKRIKTTFWNWKNSSNHSMATVAEELISNARSFSQNDLAYLKSVKTYKSKVSSKMNILSVGDIGMIDSKIMRSYRIRILLNLF